MPPVCQSPSPMQSPLCFPSPCQQPGSGESQWTLLRRQLRLHHKTFAILQVRVRLTAVSKVSMNGFGWGPSKSLFSGGKGAVDKLREAIVTKR